MTAPTTIRYGSTEQVSYTATQGASTAAVVGEGRRFTIKRIQATTDCLVVVQPAGETVAASTGLPLTANVAMHLDLLAGEIINVVRVTSDGTLYVTDCEKH